MATAPEMPLDVRSTLHDCILALFWPKKKIVEFLVSVNCPAEIVEASGAQTSRHEIVTEAFSRLSRRPDRGFPVYQIMIDRLSNWTYFDPYWFDKMEKLDRQHADRCIKSLKDGLQARNSSTTKRREAAETTFTTRRKSADLSALTGAFSKLFGSSMTVQARGRLFETFLKELFTRQSIKMGDGFNIQGEQIDGTFKFEGENYVVEAKWQDPSTSTGDLYKFAHKVDGKMHGRGIFISVNGYANDAIRAIVHGKHIKTILIDGQDLSFVLEDRLSLEAMLDYKIRAAQTRGEVYVCSVLQQSKL